MLTVAIDDLTTHKAAGLKMLRPRLPPLPYGVAYAQDSAGAYVKRRGQEALPGCGQSFTLDYYRLRGFKYCRDAARVLLDITAFVPTNTQRYS